MMADNVVKFRKIEKKPEKPPAKKPGEPGKGPQWPAWLPWAVIVAVSVGFVAIQQSGLFGG
jgi:hypothetical protein